MLFRNCFSMILFTVSLSIGMGNSSKVFGDEKTSELKSTAVAPANSRQLQSTLGGAYYVDNELFSRQEALKERLQRIRSDIENRTTTSDEALKTLATIEHEFASLKVEIEKKKVLVSAFHVYSKTTEETFPMGEERLVIVTGDNVKIRGWEGPGLKCVVEKIVIAKEQPNDSEFDAIQIEHQLVVPVDIVGMTDQEREADEQKFLQSEAGRKLTGEQKSARQRLLDDIRHSFDNFRDFQGRKVNTIALTGLQYQEGNHNLFVEIKSPDGRGSSSSQWQRHANMTIYLAACKSLAVRGCQVGLDIEDVTCDLLLTTAGSRDRNYEGHFAVRGVKGNVTIDQAPVRDLSDVTGNVRYTATNEFVNTAMIVMSGGIRSRFSFETAVTRIDNVQGNLTADFLRTDLKLAAIGGLIDIANQFGSTELRLNKASSQGTQRIVSESGTIHVVGPTAVLKKSLLYAYTQCGTMRTNLANDVLEDVNFSTGQPQMGWHGFTTPSSERFSMEKFDRPAAALEGRERPAGIDVISRAGTVSVMAVPEAKRKKEAEQK